MTSMLIKEVWCKCVSKSLKSPVVYPANPHFINMLFLGRCMCALTATE